MQAATPSSIYDQRIKELTTTRKKLLTRQTIFGWSRFLTLTASILFLWKLWSAGEGLAIGAFIFFIAVFMVLVIRDLKNKEAIGNIMLLLHINRQELKALEHQVSDFPDGREFIPETHAYAIDLDIFGKASVYQYINRTTSQQGNRRLADWLLNPADSKTIFNRQEAAKELSNPIAWSQQLRAYGISNPITTDSENKIGEWLKTDNPFISSPLWKLIRFGYPLIALGTIALLVWGVINSSLFTFLAFAFFILTSIISGIIRPHYLQLNKSLPQLESLQNSLRWMENMQFKSGLLAQLKQDVNLDGPASASIRELKKILERFDYRFNPLVHVPLNIYFLWDLQQVFALEKWKSKNTLNITGWYNALAEIEALISISTLSFNHPDWSIPSLTDDSSVFDAINLGHPLIPKEKRVTNSFVTRGEKQLSLVTGSNMAGKSTFLRSIGVNLVLSMMGAATCTKKLVVSHMKVMSTMRINDNLEENTSTFYAELKKLKDIIQAVHRNEKVFLLLDEILRGTNSADRHTGSIALIRQLIRHDGSGVIATHDLELTKLSEEFPEHLHNYHFDAQVKDEELFFDYKLKTGICRSMNASLLMKKIGIEL